MDSLKKLSSSIDTIDTLCNQILGSAIVILNELKDDDNEILRNVLDYFRGATASLHDEALDLLREKAFEYVKDANVLKAELPKFVKEHPDGKGALIDETDCPFLKEVWCGDMYDKIGIAGLKALIDDLREQLANINKSKLEEEVVKILQERAPRT
jgi:hypothetical protein